MLEHASPRERLHFACRSGDDVRARSVLREHLGIIEAMMPEDHRAIADAAWDGDVRAVALMLDLGFDPRVPGHDSGTAVHCAAWAGSAETVEALLRHGDAHALMAIRDSHHGATPLGWCCHGSRSGAAGQHAHAATLLLEAGARPGSDTREASAPVEAVLAAWDRESHVRR